MNFMVQQSIEANIASFIKKYKADNKSKVGAKMNHIYKELDNLSLSGSVISAISGMEDIPDNA